MDFEDHARTMTRLQLCENIDFLTRHLDYRTEVLGEGHYALHTIEAELDALIAELANRDIPLKKQGVKK